VTDRPLRFETRAIHEGGNPTDPTGAVIPPICVTSTFAHGNSLGYDYTRSGNPNFRQLDAIVAAAEGAEFCTSFGSGVSAITAVVSSLQSGDTILAEENLYGCTYRLFEQVFKKFGLELVYADLTAEEGIGKISEIRPRLVWLESPTNPLLKILDLEKIAAAAADAGAETLVDNTFASSVLQQPLSYGITLSLLSTTKYTNGHSDALGGAVCTDDAGWHERMVFAQKALGLQPSPFDAWLTARGAKTQALRMERHSETALKLAAWLEEQPGIRWVRYPFLASHPQTDLARRQMKGGSGIITLEVDGGLEQTLTFCQRLELFTMAESLGGIESLVCHPASMTHASVPKAVREAVGISDSLIRLSVGIEYVEDLREDLKSALFP